MAYCRALIKMRKLLVQMAPTNLTGDNVNLLHQLPGATGYEAWRVFDGNDNTFFRTVGFPDLLWVGWDFGSAISIRQYKWYHKSLSAAYMDAWNFEYSDNNSSWTSVDQFFSENVPVNTWYTSRIFNVGAHQYWRLWLKHNSDGNLTNAGAGTLWMFAYQ